MNMYTKYIGGLLLLVAGYMLGSYLYQNYQADKLSFMSAQNSEVFVRDYSPRYGDKDAKVYLTEFLDPECESCRLFYPQVKDLLKEYDGKVQLVVRYAAFHPNSVIAIKALEAARLQGKYWEALEMLFHYQPYWGSHHNPKPELIFTYLENMGLDMEKLREDMKSEKIAKIIQQDSEDLRALEVRGTPTFFVNGKPLKEFGIDPLRKLIRKELMQQH